MQVEGYIDIICFVWSHVFRVDLVLYPDPTHMPIHLKLGRTFPSEHIQTLF